MTVADKIGVVLMVVLSPLGWLAGRWIAAVITTFLTRR
jgi:hypothetical protein